MKKITLLAVAFVAVTFASCKKNYTCVCTGSQSGSGSYSYTYDLGKIKKKDAKSTCNSVGASWVTIGGTCEAKVK